jgi:transcriptional regulator with XRE-family HTH domain
MMTRRFAMRLKQVRRRKGLSRYALAKRAGISAVYVQKLEDGISDPTLSMVERLAKALDVTFWDLVKR